MRVSLIFGRSGAWAAHSLPVTHFTGAGGTHRHLRKVLEGAEAVADGVALGGPARREMFIPLAGLDCPRALPE